MLAHPNDFARSIMLHKEALSLCQASSKDGQGEGPNKTFPIRASDDADNIVFHRELDHGSDMSGCGHNPALPTIGRQSPQTQPGTSSPLGIYASDCTERNRELFATAVFCGSSHINHAPTLRNADLSQVKFSEGRA